jgi:ADP-ribose pyrophosphatase YjhB (NUDIX family)
MSIHIHVSAIVCRDNQILLVQESKPDRYGCWNLPGGHLEQGETIVQGMRREVLEETGLEVRPCALIGVYTGFWESDGHAIRFVSLATTDGDAVAGVPEILAVRWIEPKELQGMDDAELVGAETLRRIVADLLSGASYPLDLLVEPERVLSGQ